MAATDSQIPRIMPLLVAVCLVSVPAQAQYGGGTGEPDDPYLIYTAEQMNAIGTNTGDWDKHFELMADIDLSEHTETKFNIIGCWDDAEPFTGVFDGKCHTISNFSYTCTDETAIALFAYIEGANAVIEDLGLIDPNVTVTGGNWIGLLVGVLSAGTIRNCYVDGGTVSGSRNVGGLTGYTRLDGTIEKCHSASSVTGYEQVGGLVGFLWSGRILDCNAVASVVGTSRVGGLVGRNSGQITNCFASGTATGTKGVGGLMGGCWSGGRVSNCSADVSVVGEDDVGGLVGTFYDGVITNCTSSGDVSGDDSVGGLAGSTNSSALGDLATVSTCYSTSKVLGNERVGGLVGNNGGMIALCYTTNYVLAEHYVGGLTGDNNGAISNCYVWGSVSGSNDVGGLVGTNRRGTISNSYSKGSVTGTNNLGGLVGVDDQGAVFNSYWDIQASGQTTSAAGMGKTTVEMKTASTFVGWGCESVWTLDEGQDYPRLRWENIPGEMITTLSPFDFVRGSGTETDPYLIYTGHEFNMIGLFPCEWSKHFKLMADIDLSGHVGTDYNIIGRGKSHPFTGVFDGNGKKIHNFSYRSTNANDVGLFGCVSDPNAQIMNLGLCDPNVEGGMGEDVGSLVGYLRDGTVTGCYARGGRVSGDIYVGGLLGRNYLGTVAHSHVQHGSVSGSRYHIGGLAGCSWGIITGCYSTGNVSGPCNTGGLIGLSGGKMFNCHSACAVSGTIAVGGLVGEGGSRTICCYASGDVQGDDQVGGLVGVNYGNLANSYAIASVKGTGEDIGGLVGWNYGFTGTAIISNCYSTGQVTGGASHVGGLIGRAFGPNSEAIDSFWDVQTSGQTTSGGGTGKTTVEMQMESTFSDAGWDFVGESINGTEDIWAICERVDYPRLAWEFVIGDFDADADRDLADFSILAEHWLAANGSFWCGQGCDLTNDGGVNWQDLMVFAENWLAAADD
jgi:hypothetical protein